MQKNNIPIKSFDVFYSFKFNIISLIFYFNQEHDNSFDKLYPFNIFLPNLGGVFSLITKPAPKPIRNVYNHLTKNSFILATHLF